jgi:hypothetical protein
MAITEQYMAMTIVEREARVGVLKETLAAHDDAALTLMKAAQKHLRAARDVNARLDRLQRRNTFTVTDEGCAA